MYECSCRRKGYSGACQQTASIMRCLVASLVIILASTVGIFAAEFEPYEIKAGLSYYSDEYSTSNDVSSLGEEKNYEEVYQYYNYYEAVFNSEERIVVFKAYEKGVVKFSETYHYDDGGQLLKKIVENPDGSRSTVNFQAE